MHARTGEGGDGRGGAGRVAAVVSTWPRHTATRSRQGKLCLYAFKDIVIHICKASALTYSEIPTLPSVSLSATLIGWHVMIIYTGQYETKQKRAHS